MGEERDGGRLLREDAARQKLTIEGDDGYASRYGINPEWFYDGRVRGRKAAERYQREQEIAEMLAGGRPTKAEKNSLMDAARTLALVWRHGGDVRSWIRATGMHPRKAQRDYKDARQTVLAARFLTPGNRAMLAAMFPEPKAGRPPGGNATNPPLVYVRGDAAPSPAALPDLPPSDPESDLLPAVYAPANGNPKPPPRPSHVRTHPPGRHPRTPERTTARG